ncbi:MAG: hypothetical protein JXR76_27750 [Deltaproteobacteria bacterium]|nr:hypothetical protein [Deltaproteobacteria bacterium]
MNTAKLLLSEKLITKEQYEQAYLDHKTDGKTIGFHLIRRNIVSSDDLVRFQMERLGMKRRDKSTIVDLPKHITELVSPDTAHNWRVLPLDLKSNIITLGMADPADDLAMDTIARYTSLTVSPTLISEDDMTWALDHYYGDINKPPIRNTMPLIPQETQSEQMADDWFDSPRDTISWGINIEDALTNAVRISAKMAEKKKSISPAPADDAPAPSEDNDVPETPSPEQSPSEIAVERTALVADEPPVELADIVPRLNGSSVPPSPEISSETAKIAKDVARMLASVPPSESETAIPVDEQEAEMPAEPIPGDRETPLIPEGDTLDVSWSSLEPITESSEIPSLDGIEDEAALGWSVITAQRELNRTKQFSGAGDSGARTSEAEERPTIIPEGDPPSGSFVMDKGVDSWVDTTPAALVQHIAAPEHRKFQSSPSTPAIMQARMSLAPPHRAHQRTEGELLHEIYTTDSRDELISLALEYILRFAGRALFLVVRKSEIRGFHVAGEYTSREAIRTFWIPFNERSTLGEVAVSGTTYLGPIGDKPADAVFCAALGGRPSHALLVPIILKNRTIGILFADQVKTQQIAWPRLNRLTEAITSSLTRFVLREKHQRDATKS